MDFTNRQRIGAIVLVISTIAAFATPFLIHSPPTQGGTGTSSNDNNGGTGGEGTGERQGAGPKRSMQDLKNAIGLCQSESHGNSEVSGYARSLLAKSHSTRTDHSLSVLQHQLGTPAAEKHASSCLDALKDLLGELMTSS